MKALLTGLAVAVAVVAVAARAQAANVHRTFDTTIPANGATALNLTGYNGDVKLIADSGATIRLHAILSANTGAELDGIKMIDARSDRAVRMTYECPGEKSFLFWSFKNCGVDYEIRYPRNLALTVRNDNGDVEIDGAAGSVSAEVSNGDVDVIGAADTISASTKHGDVTATLSPDWRGRSIELHTSTGDVHLRVDEDFSGTLQTHKWMGDVSDDAHLTGGPVPVVVTTTFGDIRITRARDRNPASRRR
jgi:hypothetical protein